MIELGEPQADLARLLREAAGAHRRAFADVEGRDPEWPAWYAAWLAPRLGGATGTVQLDPRQLPADLHAAEVDHRHRAPGVDWAEFYAEWLIDKYGGSSGTPPRVR